MIEANLTEMSNATANQTRLPPEQQAIRAKCFHPTGTFVEIRKEEIEQSIPERFEKIVSVYSDRITVKTTLCESTYAELCRGANRIRHVFLAPSSGIQELV